MRSTEPSLKINKKPLQLKYRKRSCFSWKCHCKIKKIHQEYVFRKIKAKRLVYESLYLGEKKITEAIPNIEIIFI